MIRTPRDVAVMTLCVIVGTNLSIDIVVMLVFAEPDWLFQMLFIMGVSLCIGLPVTLLMCVSMMRNTRLTEHLQSLVNRDRLTDVATRDFFFDRMDAAPHSYGVSLMIDIDHFKAVNDTYGHLAGDRVIRAVADVLRRLVRAQDIICRFGGEEFVIFLDARDAAQGFVIAERMRRDIAELTMEIAGMPVRVTVSIGGSLKDRSDQLTDAIAQADAALYRAKATGRNRTVFANGPDVLAA